MGDGYGKDFWFFEKADGCELFFAEADGTIYMEDGEELAHEKF